MCFDDGVDDDGFCFAPSDDYVYWTDWQRRAVECVNKTSGKQRMVVVEQLPDVMGLAAVSANFVSGQWLSTWQSKTAECEEL